MTYFFGTLILTLGLLLSGCVEPRGARVATRMLVQSRSFDQTEGDPVALATTRSIAVIPFDNQTGQESFTALAFSQKISTQLASFGSVRVIFPQEVEKALQKLNREIKHHNENLQKLDLLGKDPADERKARVQAGLPSVSTGENKTKELLNPVQNIDDAIRLGRILKVDAVMMGTVTDFSPYYRPRLTATVTVVLTGRNDAATNALRELTQWGVPRSLTTHRGIAWLRQQVYDSANGGIARDIYLFARNRHTEDRAFDTDIYLHDMDKFFEFIGSTIGSRYLAAREKSMHVLEERGREEARRRKLQERAVVGRIHSLTGPGPQLPSGGAVVNANERDTRDHTWRQGFPSSTGQEKAVVPATKTKKSSRILSPFWR